MKKIVFYLIFSVFALTLLLQAHNIWTMPGWYTRNLLFVKCSLIGGLAGLLYCLRAVYLNKCVRKSWDCAWEIWYYLRPLTSLLCGFFSCIFLKAGLLILDADPKTDSFIYGYLTVAFIAGYNVDNFLKRIESIANEIWCIKKSRSSGETKKSKKEETGEDVEK